MEGKTFMKTSIFKTCLIYRLQDSSFKRELIATRQICVDMVFGLVQAKTKFTDCESILKVSKNCLYLLRLDLKNVGFVTLL